MKQENNDLRFHERQEQQNKYNKYTQKVEIRFLLYNHKNSLLYNEEATDQVEAKKDGADGGQEHILPSTYTKGKRCYSQRYYDGTC